MKIVDVSQLIKVTVEFSFADLNTISILARNAPKPLTSSEEELLGELDDIIKTIAQGTENKSGI